MKIHILGICGTFMGGLARILVQSGHTVSGSDYQFYPPMSDQLEDLDLRLISGYAADQLPQADLYIIGNNLSRGNESVEKILDKNFPYQSGPRMLGSILQERKVVAISGTHGKTTTTSLIVHLFKEAGIDVGFLIGGVCNNLEHSAHLGSDDIFVIEADEYDSAFFDKRSKFIHYNPSTLIVNNIEFDHADIFSNLTEIQKQFHHILKIMPKTGVVFGFGDDRNVSEVLDMGLWCDKQILQQNDKNFGYILDPFTIFKNGKEYAGNNNLLPLDGSHNKKNMIMAVQVAASEGLSINKCLNNLQSFQGVKRRLEHVGNFGGKTIYDDFAHHPTAVRGSIEAMVTKFPEQKLLAIVEAGSNTMTSGHHNESLNDIAADFDVCWLDTSKSPMINSMPKINESFFGSHADLEAEMKDKFKDYDIFLIMTNRDSQKIIQPLIRLCADD